LIIEKYDCMCKEQCVAPVAGECMEDIKKKRERKIKKIRKIEKERKKKKRGQR